MSDLIEIAPFLKARFRITPEGKGQLIGMHCHDCGEIAFPKVVLCPKCTSKNVEEAVLSSQGTIYSYTIVYESYGNFIGLQPPYAIMFAQLSDGSSVHAPLVGCAFEDITIGMEVELDLLPTGPGSNQVAYVFKPVAVQVRQTHANAGVKHPEEVAYV